MLVTTLFIGAGEELMFRGVILERMRRIDVITELKAVLWMTAIFGTATD
ncbi:MAG: CPBP family glutamic-type intramembrane protease [Candidatus Marinimicrobia bacterium]|nr:CPBP family glutamic-type intramembrane protease [Candidatus Neomarinimicrobiota bacterium]